jgi:hypothetical protein
MASPVSPTDFFSEAIAQAPGNGIPNNYDYVSPIAGVSTGQVAAGSAQITNPVTSTNPSQPPFPDPGTGSSSATADRTVGQLHAAAGATSGNFAASAYADFGDTLKFSAHGASSNTVTTVQFAIQLIGTFSDFPAGECCTSSGLAGGTLLAVLGTMPYSGGFVGAFSPTTTSNIDTTVGVAQNFYGGPANINQVFTGSFSFTGATADAALFVFLSAQGQYQYANFGDTATFSFVDLPTNVSFTSASGDFLSGATTPLPAALPLFASGLGVMGFLAKRRRRKNGAAPAAG